MKLAPEHLGARVEVPAAAKTARTRFGPILTHWLLNLRLWCDDKNMLSDTDTITDTDTIAD